MKRFRVRFTVAAEGGLLRLFDFLLDQDMSAAERAETAITRAIDALETFRSPGARSSAGHAARFCAN
jgi:plasmid stabilization system protein ParE